MNDYAGYDDGILVVLRRDLDENAFCDILLGLKDELAQRLRSARADKPDWGAIRADTQVVLSLAAGFGFDILAEISREIQNCAYPTPYSLDLLQRYTAECLRLLSVFDEMSLSLRK